MKRFRGGYPGSRICLMIITDGRRECIEKTLDSWEEKLDALIEDTFIVDDSGNKDYGLWLRQKFMEKVDSIYSHTERIGFGETIRHAWSRVPQYCDYVFHLEDDFILNRTLVLNDWITILRENPKVVQVCAYRQPWSQAEIEAGGFIKLRPGVYTDKIYSGFPVVEHQKNFSTNPTLYPRWLTMVGWPESPESEGKLSFKLKDIDPEYVYLLWGKSTDEPMVHHFGQRRGMGY